MDPPEKKYFPPTGLRLSLSMEYASIPKCGSSRHAIIQLNQTQGKNTPWTPPSLISPVRFIQIFNYQRAQILYYHPARASFVSNETRNRRHIQLGNLLPGRPCGGAMGMPLRITALISRYERIAPINGGSW